MHNLLLISLLQVAGQRQPVETRGAGWHPTGGLTVGASFAPAEIGRATNATGGEQLIALLGNGVAIGLWLGVENQWLGLQLDLQGRADYIQVENEFGTRFPNHGGQPAGYSLTLLVYPLAPLGRAARNGSVRPFVTASAGGLVLSVDLDNIEDQTTYHLWHYGIGAGVRLFVLNREDGFLELAFRNVRVLGHGALEAFGMRSVSVGVGMRR